MNLEEFHQQDSTFQLGGPIKSTFPKGKTQSVLIQVQSIQPTHRKSVIASVELLVRGGTHGCPKRPRIPPIQTPRRNGPHDQDRMETDQDQSAAECGRRNRSPQNEVPPPLVSLRDHPATVHPQCTVARDRIGPTVWWRGFPHHHTLFGCVPLQTLSTKSAEIR